MKEELKLVHPSSLLNIPLVFRGYEKQGRTTVWVFELRGKTYYVKPTAYMKNFEGRFPPGERVIIFTEHQYVGPKLGGKWIKKYSVKVYWGEKS